MNRTTCPRCRAEVPFEIEPDGSVLCRSCGHRFDPPTLVTDRPGAGEASATRVQVPGGPEDRTVTCFEDARTISSPGDDVQATRTILEAGSSSGSAPARSAPGGRSRSAAARSQASRLGTSQGRIRLSEGQRRDLLLARALLDRRAIDLSVANSAIADALRSQASLAEILRREGKVDPSVLEAAQAEVPPLEAEASAGQTFDTSILGRFTVVRDGDRFVLEDRDSIRPFGKYELLGEIARGGMGIVYRARQAGLDRIMGLKILLAGEQADAEQVQRFLREARTAANLTHPGIVPIFDIGEVDGQYYFTMEYVSGGSLSDLLKKGPLAPKRTLHLAREIAEAVDYAHRAGIVHRDLKPSNILFDRNGVAKVTDFGLAKEVESATLLTHSGQLLGTPAYMAPEQALGDTDQVDRQSDVYALGTILYEMLTGRRPHDRKTLAEVLYAVVHRDPDPPRKIDPRIHPDLERICLKALEKEKHRRYATAGDLAADLDNFIEGRAISARSPSAAYRIRRWIARNRLAAATAAAGLAVVLATSGVLGWQVHREALLRAEAEAERLEQIEAKAAELERRRSAQPFYIEGTFHDLDGRRDDAIAAFSRAVATDPTYAEAWGRLADLYEAAGQREKAIEAHRTAAAHGYATSYNEAGRLLEAEGRWNEAIAAYDQAFRVTRSPEVLFNRGVTRYRMGDVQGARADLEAVLESRPDFARADYVLGDLSLQSEDRAAALERFERAARLLPDYLEAADQVARVLLDLDRNEEALARLEGVVDRLDERGTPRTGDLWRKVLSHRGTALYRLGRREVALEDFEAVRRIHPDYGPDSDRPLARSVRSLHARTLWTLGRRDEAIALFREAIASDPNDVESRLALASLLTGAVRLDEAQATLEGLEGPAAGIAAGWILLARGEAEKALERARAGGASVEARVLEAAALVALDRPAEAMTVLEPVEAADRATCLRTYLSLAPRSLWWSERARRIAPEDPRALRAYLRALRSLDPGDWPDEASPAAAALQRLVPDDPEGLEFLVLAEKEEGDLASALEWADRLVEVVPAGAQGYFLRGTIRLELRSQMEALADLGTARNLAPDRSDVLFALGRTYFEFELWDAAERFFDDVLERDPTFHEARLRRGLCRAKRGLDAPALEDLDRYLEQAEHVDAYYNRAVLRLRAGQRDEAKADLRRVLELDPDDARAREILERLGE